MHPGPRDFRKPSLKTASGLPIPAAGRKRRAFSSTIALYWILGSPVDQFAVSDDIKVLNVSTGPDIGSDHLPLIIEIELPAKN